MEKLKYGWKKKGNLGIRNTLITTFGLEKNKYSSVFSSVITMDDLFVL